LPDDNGNPIIIKRSTFNIVVAVAVAALIVFFFGGYILSAKVGGIGVTNTIVQQGGGQHQPEAFTKKIQSVSIDEGDPIKGKPDAPVTMVEFADFQCPFCARYAINTFPQIEKEYISSGKLKYVYKDFPVEFHINAKPAALAAQCANEQGKFWEYHDILFKNQPRWKNQDGNLAATTFKKYATDAGLNAASFGSCLDSKKYEEKIDMDAQQGSTYNIPGTPTFYIGNEKQGYTEIPGAQPFQSFKTTIDQLLSSS
jgi:protein-disulfide isomerase